MKRFTFVPCSPRDAAQQLREALHTSLATLPKQHFVRAWSSIAYLFPGLHPDAFADADSGWPRVLRRFAVEAWKRADAGELNDDELYPSDSQWAGLYDQMSIHTRDEMERRVELKELSAACATC